MFFKRVEAIGFKSFATRTHVDLVPGVTVVVGPNGCGKSNILDAIKWVLGDQSPKSLRGSKMQDVIFAGSSSFKPMGMAQVTLTLDNRNRTLDIDYDEVQVTRRLFRSGESEYLLNKVPCRLKDIHNLFLGTGVGTSAYSILEQGKVDQIINAKPADRRFIFEEAAGIAKYKVRRLEAQRKLDRTSDDLHRLNDLISEVERQVASLKRQANKAERYREHADQLHKGEKELLVLRSADLRGRLKAVEGEIAGLQDRQGELEAALARESAAEEQAAEAVDRLDAELTQRGSDLYQVKSRITDLDHQVQRLKDRITGGENRLRQIAAEREGLERQREELETRRSEVATRLDQAREDEANARTEFEERQRLYNELEAEVKAEAGRLEELSRAANHHRDELSRCENEMRIAEALVTSHEEKKGELQADLERTSEELTGLVARRDELAGKVEALEAKVAERRGSLSETEIRYAEVRGRIADLGDELQALRKDLHQRQARLNALEELKKSFEGFRQGVRDIMKQADAGKLAGVIAPLANLIKAGPEYEQALEVALGQHVQDVLVDDLAAARGAIDFLAESGHGRATFWPLAETRGIELNGKLAPVLEREGVRGHAADLVTCEERLRPVVKALLAGTIVVENLDAAMALRGEFADFSFVTLDGRMLRASGALIGGSAETSGLLGREREIADLKETVGSLSARESELAGELTTARESSDTLQRKIDAGKNELQQLLVEKAHERKDLEAAERRHEEARTRLEKTTATLEQLEGGIAVKLAEIEERRTRSAEHQAKLTEVTRQLEEQRERTKTQSEDFMRRGSELASARAEIDRVRERLTHLEENLQAIEREAANLTASLESRGEEDARIEADIEAARGEIDKTQEQLQGLFERRGELEKTVATEETERDQLRLKLREIKNRMESAERDGREVENDLHDRQLKQTEFASNLRHLSEQAEEKFGVGLEAIAEEIGAVEADAAVLAQEVAQLRQKIERMGPVNMAALEEYDEQRNRLDFLTAQREDLVRAKEQIEESIAAIDETTKTLFHETFESIRTNFIEMFRRLFNGGKADLVIEQEGDDPLLEGGIEILAQPPGKKLQSLSLMSGGEKAMTAISLLFALFLHKPAPFAILDEIDAPLDDANVERFKNVVQEFAAGTQFIIITHNKQTMHLADALYGVTMQESGVSKLVSVQFENADEFLPTATG